MDGLEQIIKCLQRYNPDIPINPTTELYGLNGFPLYVKFTPTMEHDCRAAVVYAPRREGAALQVRFFHLSGARDGALTVTTIGQLVTALETTVGGSISYAD